MERPGSWFFGGWEKSLSDVRHRRGDAHGCHHSFLKGAGFPLPTPLPHTGGNPRICPGSSVVIVVSLLEGVA